MSGLRIAVIGCCNGPGIANIVRLLRPLDTVIPLMVDNLEETAFVETQYDVVFAVANASEFGLAGRLARCAKVVYWPNPVFFGFHPDIVYFGIDGRPVRSAMGDYNSFVAAACYADGLDVRATVRLFNKLVYARLGYFRYELSRTALIAAADAVGFDLRHAFAGWERQGVFMYSINHPKLCVLEDIAKICLRKADLEFDERLCVADHVPDHLALGGVWPVYPEIAREIGVAGSALFSLPCHQHYDVGFLGLGDFVEKTFAIYERDGFTREKMAELAGMRAVSEKLAA